MSIKKITFLTGLVMAGLLVLTACATASAQSEMPVIQSSGQQDITGQGQGGGIGEAIDVTPMSEEELATQGTGQSGPGAAPDDPGMPQDDPGERAMLGPTTSFKDETYKFQINYPVDFVVKNLPADALADLEPRPDTAFTFMNPVTAASDVPETEIADLEIRVYKPLGQVDSLEAWLKSVGLLFADSATALPFETTSKVSGLQVCGNTMIFPGCSYFILGDGLVYQFRAANTDGEYMMNTFTILP